MRDNMKLKCGFESNQGLLIEEFVVDLLKSFGALNIKKAGNRGLEGMSRNFDIVSQIDQDFYIFEIKAYRNITNSKVILNNAIKDILMYQRKIRDSFKGQKINFVLIMTCKVEPELKREIFNSHNVVIWDICNLIYLTKDNQELFNALERCISYPLKGMESIEPIETISAFAYGLTSKPSSGVAISEAQSLIKCLKECGFGCRGGNDKKYEKICTDIIKYLFESEFLKRKVQKITDDKLFRMDLICSLKGTTEFWRFLINFYKTKFVVLSLKTIQNRYHKI